MSVAMALAETLSTTAQRQKKARAREEEREVLHTAAFRTTVPPPKPEFFCIFDGELDGGRPGSVMDPAPQGLVELHRGAHRFLAVLCRSSVCLCRSWGGRNR